MPAPFEIVGQPLTLWLAPFATAFPLVDATPAGTWVLIGTSGQRSQDESGIMTTYNQSINKVRPGGALGPVKAFRSEEDLMFKLTIWDVTLEQVRIALNANAVTTTAATTGVAGTKRIGMSRGFDVTEYALLARGVSPYADAMNAQYEVPRCFMSNSPSIVYKKATPAAVELEFTALEDPNAASAQFRFGTMRFQHQVAL